MTEYFEPHKKAPQPSQRNRAIARYSLIVASLSAVISVATFAMTRNNSNQSVAGLLQLNGVESTTDQAAAASAETANPGEVGESAVDSSNNSAESDSEQDDLGSRFVGRWRQYLYGERSLTIRDDGTGTMVVVPEGVWAFVFGEKVTVELKWAVEEGFLNYEIVSGQPEEGIKVVKEMWGDHWSQEILTLTDSKFVVISDDDNRYEWERVNSTGTSE